MRGTRKTAVFIVAVIGASALLAVALSPRESESDTATATIQVSTTVAATCVVATTNMAFGTYTGQQTDATASVTVTCTATTPYYVNLGDGLHYDAGFYPNMQGPGAARLSYRLFQDAGRTIDWRNTDNLDGRAGTGTGFAQPLTVYGRVWGGQYVAPGAYSDTVTATVHY